MRFELLPFLRSPSGRLSFLIKGVINPDLVSFQNEAKYQLAQASDNCRRVNTRTSNLNVRSSPGGPIIGSLTDRTLVSIENTGSNGWVPISSPQQGYVFGGYLNLCEEPVPPSETATLLDISENAQNHLEIGF
jgi:hypothetical protein